MRKHPRYLAHAAIIAALYAVLTHFQNILLPGSASWAVQVRLAEGLCALALLSPAAPMGLALGCLLFNLSFSAALPLDFLLGTLATYLSGRLMWRLRRQPALAFFMPALCNGLLVGMELSLYLGGGFLASALSVALGECIALFTLGSVLYTALKRRKLDVRLFS